MTNRPNIYASDAAREAAAIEIWEFGVRKEIAREYTNAAIDTFLAKSLEGADEKLAEIRELANACRTWAAENGGGNGFLSAEAAIGLDRAATLVTALSAKLKAQKAAHAKMLRDYANHEPLDLRRPAEIQHDLRRLADKIEGGG